MEIKLTHGQRVIFFIVQNRQFTCININQLPKIMFFRTVLETIIQHTVADADKSVDIKYTMTEYSCVFFPALFDLQLFYITEPLYSSVTDNQNLPNILTHVKNHVKVPNSLQTSILIYYYYSRICMLTVYYHFRKIIGRCFIIYDIILICNFQLNTSFI